jgi:hypothetical protein
MCHVVLRNDVLALQCCRTFAAEVGGVRTIPQMFHVVGLGAHVSAQ